MNWRIAFFWVAVATATLLSGEWKNELGSVMSLQATGGVLNGQFLSAVGNASGSYSLVGLYNSDSVLSTLGFCVAWTNAENGDSRAATCWTGFIATERTLLLTWLLTDSPLSVADQWRINTLNTDTFHKQ